jgi:Ca2+-transporting ATPase
MTDAELAERVGDVTVFARVVPEQKLRIVQAFAAAGNVVAMTGDGVNDAPALSAAHIGVAMGKRGTDVAREAADLVLVDDDFSSIVTAIAMGRRIYDNIRKAVRYVISVHVPIAGVSLLPVLLKWPLVLLPLHIVVLELIIDPACSIAFEAEPQEPDAMDRPPRGLDEGVITARSLTVAIAQGALALLAVCGLLAAAFAGGSGADGARSLAFSGLVVVNLCLIVSGRRSAPGRFGLRGAPRALWVVLGGALSLLAALLAIPWLRQVFQLAPLSATDLVLITAAGVLSLGGFEAAKFLGGASAPARRDRFLRSAALCGGRPSH